MILIVTNEIHLDAINNIRKLYSYLRNMNIPFMTVKKCDPEITKRTDIEGIIIPGSSGNMRISLDKIQPKLELELYYLFHFPNLPVLGICHGCQFLMVYYGGSLIQYDTYLKGKLSTEFDLKSHMLFEGCEKIQDTHFHFHDLPIQNGAHNNNIKEIAWFTFRDNKRRACAFEFERGRVYGVMFHPEMIDESHVILYNFYYNLCI
jgi:anthranilate/para-aminobenzoate synthase component II